MRSTISLMGLAALVVLPLISAASLAVIQNDGALADLVIPDTYIVKYKATANATVRRKHEEDVNIKSKNANKRGIFGIFDVPALQGYAAEIPQSELNELMESDLIEYIEKDTIVKTAAVAANPDLAKRTMVTQHNAPWGLGRISHRAANSTEYYYSDTAGNGIRVYVIDSGIRLSHVDFGGRAVWGANFISNSSDTDEDGHGTHVTGIIAGKTYGVAKKATVVAVKVLDKSGSGSMSGLLQGLNWAVADAKHRGVTDKAVINMSLTGAYTQSVNEGVKAATDAGITVVVAAGNKHDNVTNWSPASAATAITVGAIDQGDRRADFSNWGPEVDIFAPGVGIPSAWYTSDHARELMSGTSMATPHVAGLAAYFIAREELSGSAAVTERILSAASEGVSDREGSADRIAYNGNGR